ncbi:endonuclease/exonuclease/phosphatase family protein, partial [Salmonella sp. s51228]|uniref:endonuclease/exonuclease/phosphatase family protein n=1 Tax=Salmonella sp. s51228 TaxID=3159652 RepID=UPI00397ED768
WALKWDYRSNSILIEMEDYKADVFCLQEVETDQFHRFFLPKLSELGYDGIFAPKSRAKTMQEHEGKFVDGCAIFYKTSKFILVEKFVVEFNQ